MWGTRAVRFRNIKYFAKLTVVIRDVKGLLRSEKNGEADAVLMRF